MKKFMHGVFPLILALLLGPLCFAQDQLSEGEQKELGAALSEAGNSPVEFARILEQHLKKYPDSPKKDELERTLVKAAIEANDKQRILTWGESRSRRIQISRRFSSVSPGFFSTATTRRSPSVL